MHTWELWYPKAASTGLLFARGRLDVTRTLLVHAAPDVLTVVVRDENDAVVASGTDLPRTAESPISLLSIEGDQVGRGDVWPGPDEIGLPVILPGGEVGILKSWWHAGDHKEWRWQVEFYNSLR